MITTTKHLKNRLMTLREKFGDKWQSERMYSEDEVIAFVKWMYDYKADINKVEELLNLFKKK